MNAVSTLNIPQAEDKTRDACVRDWIWISPTMRGIAEATASSYGLTLNDLRSAKRARRPVRARQLAMAECFAAGFSNRQIVRFFGLNDHKVCIQARKAVAARAVAQQVAA